MMRFFVLFSLCAAVLLSCAREDGPEARIAITQRPDAALAIVYELRRPQTELAFNGITGEYRAAQWDLPPGFALRKEGDREIIARRDGERFETLALTARPASARLPKEYQPVAPYGAGGVLVYTGHFWPLTEGGARANVIFDLTPAEGGRAVAFGDNEPALKDWQSPMAHPAFVYLGPLAPIETDNIMAVIDPETPDWIVGEFSRLVPESFEKLSALFGAAPDTKPNLFLAAAPGKPAQLSYAGDALPAQFQIMLEGGVWSEPNDQARGVFIQATVHEAVHLWQAAARPGASKPPEWIHEGAADAIAAEIMVALGEWGAAEFEADEAKARRECARELDRGTTLNGAMAKGYYRALYACGHVIAAAVSRAEGASTADFWRAFIAQAGPEGYSEAMFYALVAERTGDPAFAGAVEDFARKPLARPEREIDGLFAAAGALARERGR